MNNQKLFCKYCNKEKSTSEFYKNNHYKCKKCLIEVQKEYYKKNREKIKKYSAEWSRRNPIKIKESRERCVEKQAEYYRNWYKIKGRKRAKDYNLYIRQWRKNNSEAYKAHRLSSYAIGLGFLEVPLICEICKKERKILGHHKDYSKPLEVTWLCYSCHAKLNRK